jgi:hypothetical protein
MATVHGFPASHGARRVFTAAAAAALLAHGMACAATQQLQAVDLGYFSSAGVFNTSSYLTGISFAQGNETRGFLAFDLNALPREPITAAWLRIENLASNDADLRVVGLPFTEAANFGRDNGQSANLANFNYIGSAGTPRFAQTVLGPAGAASVLELQLNAAGVADLNANRDDSYYAYGLRVSLADAQEPKPLQFAFGGVSQLAANQRAQLVVEYASAVPEPTSAWLLLAGLLLMPWVAQRRSARLRAGR